MIESLASLVTFFSEIFTFFEQKKVVQFFKSSSIKLLTFAPLCLAGHKKQGISTVASVDSILISTAAKSSITNFISLATFDIKDDRNLSQTSNLDSSPTVGGCRLDGLRSSPLSQGEVHQAIVKVDLD